MTFLEQQANVELRLAVAPDRETFSASLPGALVALCPDGVAIGLQSTSWQALATGRRRVPWNLRPVAVLVSRLGTPGGETPWSTAPGRTAFGDSLSLVCLAPLCEGDAAASRPAGVTWGRDPYDHRALVAAAAYGAFDHVVARQWDVAAVQATGVLDPNQWRVRRLSDPMPDVVVLGSRRLTSTARLDLQQALAVLGRESGEQTPQQASVRAHLGQLGLDGFNLLLTPDFDRIRRRFCACWPGTTD